MIAIRSAMVRGAALLALTACSGGAGQPRAVLDRFYAARIAGNDDAALLELARSAGRGRTPSGPALVAYEVIDLDVWAEHAAVCKVRERYADDQVEEVQVQLVREAGAWKIGSTMRGPDASR